VLLLAAVAMPPKRATAHGEDVQVDIVRADEVPDLPEVPESLPEQSPALEQPPQLQQAETAPPPPQQPPTQTQLPAAQSQPQPPQRRQAQQPAPQPQQQPQQQSPQPHQQASQPWPEQAQQSVAESPVPGGTLAEQHERLAAMLNLPGPGTGDGSGATESPVKAELAGRERAAFRAHLKSCWQLPAGVAPDHRLKIIVRISLKQNGTLAADPQLIEVGGASSAAGPQLVQAAIKAAKQCAPYTMLPAEKYKEWRILDINFSPDEMARS
jgi:hypothetical protein